MFEITCSVNGRPVALDDLADELERSILSDLVEQIKQRADSIACQVHGQAGHVEVAGAFPDEVAIRVSGCCEALIRRVEAAINSDLDAAPDIG